MKRIGTILLSLLLCLAFCLTGCGLIEKEMTDEEERKAMEELLETVDLNAGTDYEGTLKIMYQDIPSERKIMDAFLDAFSAKYPKITIERQKVVESNYISLLQSKHSAAYYNKDFSQMPDVLWTTNEVMGGMMDRDMLMPINYFDEKDENFSVDDTLVASMVADSKLGNNLYLMPRDYDQIVMYYNRDLLAKAGVKESEIPSDRPMTHDEFDALMRKLRNYYKSLPSPDPSDPNDPNRNPENERAYNQVRALDAVLPWGSLCWPILKSYGGTVIAEDGSVNFNSEANVEAVTYMREMIKDELVFSGTTKHSQFVNQMSVLCFETRAVLTDLIERGVAGTPGIAPENLGVAPMPNLGKDGNYAVGAGCSGYSMYRYATNPTAAWLFLKFIVSEEGQNAFSKTGNGVPVNESMLHSEDAVWRNLPDEFSKLTNFNHDAFVYAYDTAACTLQDFKLLIDVVKAREPVSKEMTNCISLCLNTRVDGYEQAIKDNIKNSATSMHGIIEGYRDR